MALPHPGAPANGSALSSQPVRENFNSLDGRITTLEGAGPSGNATQIQGRTVVATAPTNGQVLEWNQPGNQWQPGTVAGGGSATQLQGRNVAATAPTADQVLQWNGPANQWQPGTVAAGGPGGVAVAHFGPTEPPSAVNGTLWWDQSEGTFKIRLPAGWWPLV